MVQTPVKQGPPLPFLVDVGPDEVHSVAVAEDEKGKSGALGAHSWGPNISGYEMHDSQEV